MGKYMILLMLLILVSVYCNDYIPKSMNESYFISYDINDIKTEVKVKSWFDLLIHWNREKLVLKTYFLCKKKYNKENVTKTYLLLIYFITTWFYFLYCI